MLLPWNCHLPKRSVARGRFSWTVSASQLPSAKKKNPHTLTNTQNAYTLARLTHTQKLDCFYHVREEVFLQGCVSRCVCVCVWMFLKLNLSNKLCSGCARKRVNMPLAHFSVLFLRLSHRGSRPANKHQRFRVFFCQIRFQFSPSHCRSSSRMSFFLGHLGHYKCYIF